LKNLRTSELKALRYSSTRVTQVLNSLKYKFLCFDYFFVVLVNKKQFVMKNFITFFLVLNSLLFSQWTQIDLYPFQGSILDFCLKDSLNITAVFQERYRVDGDSCFVIKSSDGGRNWAIHNKIPITPINYAKVIDEDNIFAANTTTTTNTIKKSTDNGSTWYDVAFPPTFNLLRSIHFFNPDTAYAAVNFGTAGYGRLLKTTDGGLSWEETDSIARILYFVKFADFNNGWIMGADLLETTDGGNSFTQIPAPTALDNITSFDILNDSIIALAGYRIYNYPPTGADQIIQTAYSTDRGQSWSFNDYFSKPWKGTTQNLMILDEDTAIAFVRTMPGIIYTTNGGVSWDMASNGVLKFYFNDIKQLGERVYLAGTGMSFLASEPGNNIAEQWELRTDQSYKLPKCAVFSESGLVVLGAQENRMFISTDRGNTWEIKYGQIAQPSSSFLVNDSLIYMSDGARIYRTVDICNSFDLLATFYSGTILDLKVTKNGTIWIALQDTIMASNDNGITWEVKLLKQNEYFKKICVFDDGTYYVQGSYLYKSTDFGGTWQLMNLPFNYLNQIEFYDSKNGFVKGGGNFYRTKNGAMTFTVVTFPGMLYPYYMFSHNYYHFHLAASNLYSTYDGGLSWQLNEFYPAAPQYPFFIMHMYNDFEGIGISSSSNGIWITKNRGNTPVELSSFSAIPLGNKVVLQWTTVTEINNMGFEIERKFKDGSWEKIGSVKGNGTVTQKVHYSFDDHTVPGEGIYNYRLKQIDYNGAFEYSAEVEVIYGEVPEEYAIQQNYPNPFNPSTKINFSLPEENKVVIRIFNPLGELVQEINMGTLSHGHFEQDIDMGSNPSGMYFCQVLCTNTKTERTKSLTIKMVLMK
jgi:photosystem II stability/assembly factor-like uncharacterized protein